jgi:TrmH family RNA methyltransferase
MKSFFQVMPLIVFSSRSYASLAFTGSARRSVRALQHSRRRTNQHFTSSASYSSLPLSSNLLDILEEIDQPVTSTKSKTVKLYQSVSSKSKFRSKNNLTILEGHRLIIDTLADEHHQTRKLYRDVLVTRDALLHPQLGGKLSQQLERVREEGCPVRLASESVMKAACDTVTPQGVAAVVDIPPPFEAKEIQDDDSKSKLYLLLDGISDPGNVGTLLRSAKAVGAEAVILLPNSCDVWNPKAIRSAMGTSFQVPIRTVKSWDECLEFLNASCGVPGDRIYAATMEDGDGVDGNGSEIEFKSQPHFEVDWSSNSNALVLGKEGPGLSKELRNSVKNGQIRSVYVPMEAGIESLNAAVCGSVIMFEYLRQYQCLSKS